MAQVRIVTAGVSLLLLLALALTSAAAQTAGDSAPGQPLPLLQFIHKDRASKAKPRPELARQLAKKKPVERRIAKRTFIRRRRAIADARPLSARVQTAAVTPPQKTEPPPQNIWPAADTAAPAATPTLAPEQAPASITTEAVADTSPNQIVAGGHSVLAALPNGLEPDAAGSVPDGGKPTPQITAPQSAAAAPVVHAMVVKAEPQGASEQSPISSASWLAHMLAALGGAIAAGAVAWFLIRPAPERTYE